MDFGSRISRRGFLKGTAAFAVPYIVPAGVLAKGPTAPSNRIAVGCIGLRNMGRNHLLSLLGRNEVEVVGLCDVDANVLRDAVGIVKVRRLGRGCPVHGDFRELLARDDVDAVSVATPDHWHVLIGIAAAKAGKDMYIEKPLTLTIAQGKALRDAVRRYGRVNQTGSQQRSDYKFRYACELVRNGRIGKLQKMTVGLPGGRTLGPQPVMPVPKGFNYDMWLGPAPWAPYTEKRCHYNFRFILDYSGGQITNWGAHHIDIAQWGNGTDRTGPVEIEGKGEYARGGLYNTATRYRFTCTYANGVELIVATGQRGGVRFEGTDGRIYVDRSHLEAQPRSILKSRIAPDEIHLYDSRSHWGNWIDCIRNRKQTVAPFEIGHRSVSISHMGNICMQLERKLRWDPDKEQFINDDEANRMLSRAMRPPWHT